MHAPPNHACSMSQLCVPRLKSPNPFPPCSFRLGRSNSAKFPFIPERMLNKLENLLNYPPPMIRLRLRLAEALRTRVAAGEDQYPGLEVLVSLEGWARP